MSHARKKFLFFKFLANSNRGTLKYFSNTVNLSFLTLPSITVPRRYLKDGEGRWGTVMDGSVTMIDKVSPWVTMT